MCHALHHGRCPRLRLVHHRARGPDARDRQPPARRRARRADDHRQPVRRPCLGDWGGVHPTRGRRRHRRLAPGRDLSGPRRDLRARRGEVRRVAPLRRHDASAVGDVVGRAPASTPRPPVIGVGVIPLTLSSPHVPPFGPGLRYAAGRAARLRNRVLNLIIEKVVLRQQQREAQAAVGDCVPGARLSGYFMNGLRVVDVFMELSVASLDYPRPDLPPNIRYAGPVLPRASSTAQLPGWWAELDGSRPVVLVTQGTVDTRDLDRLLGPTVRGLAGEDVMVVAVTGGPPVERLGPLPANVRAATRIPFDLLMSKVSLMGTNGGFGGVHFALAHDVPLVVAGNTEDKPEVAARVEWAGVAVSLRTGTPSADQVRDAVRGVLKNESYRARAHSIGEDIRRSDALGAIAAEVDARTTMTGRS